VSQGKGWADTRNKEVANKKDELFSSPSISRGEKLNTNQSQEGFKSTKESNGACIAYGTPRRRSHVSKGYQKESERKAKSDTKLGLLSIDVRTHLNVIANPLS